MVIKLLLIIIVLLSGCEDVSFAKTASWYGANDKTDPWKHVVTASGAKFNENALACASWKYPLGSRVKVTNLSNGRSVVVLVNDRGPGRRLYRKGRIIDLTKASFAKIDKLEVGVIKIKCYLIRGDYGTIRNNKRVNFGLKQGPRRNKTSN